VPPRLGYLSGSGNWHKIGADAATLFLVLLKTKVPNGTGLSPRLSKNLSQALRTDRLWPLLKPSNFSASRLACESRAPKGPSSPNSTRKTFLLFIAVQLYGERRLSSYCISKF
jgi:hypothetical protein